jgi:hypothetical protein
MSAPAPLKNGNRDISEFLNWRFHEGLSDCLYQPSRLFSDINESDFGPLYRIAVTMEVV